MDGGDTEKKEGGEEEALRKELRLSRKRIAELEVENKDLIYKAKTFKAGQVANSRDILMSL